MNKPRVLISILNWNKSSQTLTCVDSLERELATAIADVTILVIDNGSRQEDVAKLKLNAHSNRFELKILPQNLGFTGGHNIAIQIAIDEAYDFIWLMNNDATVSPGALSQLIETMQSQPQCGVATPVIRELSEAATIEACLNTFDWRYRTFYRIYSIDEARQRQDEHPDGNWVAGTAAFFRVKALLEAGKLDDRIFAYYDDPDICARLGVRGWRSLCVFSASVFHESKGRPEELPLYCHYLTQRNEMLFWQKNVPREYRKLLWLRIVDGALYRVNVLYRNGLKEQGDAALLGVSDFLCRRFGAPVLDRKVSIFLRAACGLYRMYFDKKFDRSATGVGAGN